jgi:ribosomal protein S12 methylthiotransferase accessory factor
MERLGAEVELYSLDAGLRTAVVACLALGNGVTWPGALVGCGAGGCVATAVCRAVLEAASMGPQLRRMLHARYEVPRGRPPRDPVDHALHYLPADRKSAFDFLRSPEKHAVPVAQTQSTVPLSVTEWAARARSTGVRVAVADVTSPTVSHTPWRVVRALGTHAQPLDFGMRFQRLANPRLEGFLAGASPNADPHPLA